MGKQLTEPTEKDVRGTATTPLARRAHVASVPWLDAATSALLREVVAMLANQHPELASVILFGSIARHEERPLDDPGLSDIDLLLVVKERLDDMRTALEQAVSFHRLIGQIEDQHSEVGREIQITTVDRHLTGWDPLFIENVARDGILLWARAPLPAPLAAVAERSASRSTPT